MVPPLRLHVPIWRLALLQLDAFSRQLFVWNCLEQVSNAVEPRSPCIVGINDVPRREIRIGSSKHRVARAGIVVPAAVRLQVHPAQLPDLASVVDPLLETF